MTHPPSRPQLVSWLHRWRVWITTGLTLAAFALGVLTPVPGAVRGPLVDINDGVLIAVLVALGGFVAQVYLRLGKLEDRLGVMEQEKGEALSKLTLAASFINRVGLWLAGGQRGPMPQPSAQLDDHIDTELWEAPQPERPSPVTPQHWAE